MDKLIHALFDYEKHQELKSGYFRILSAGRYFPLDSLISQTGKMIGQTVLYKGRPSVNAQTHRPPAYTLLGLGSSRLSGIYLPDIHHPDKGFGYVYGTHDLLLVSHTPTTIQILVSIGRKDFYQDVFSFWADGQLDDEISELRSKMIGGKQMAA